MHQSKHLITVCLDIVKDCIGIMAEIFFINKKRQETNYLLKILNLSRLPTKKFVV